MKIIVSGNPEYGVAKAICEHFNDVESYSRSHNLSDFLSEVSRKAFAKESLNFDVYVCCSSLQDFAQTLLLKEVSNLWIENRKKGHIVVMGSVLEEFVDTKLDFYSIEKKSLRAFCRSLSLNSCYETDPTSVNFKISYVSTGFLDTPGPALKSKVAISCKEIAKTIDWLINQPPHINVSEICVDPIQKDSECLT